MKVMIAGQIYDSEKVPIAIIWDEDHQRYMTGINIKEMPPKVGPRIFLTHNLPEKEALEWLEHIKKRLGITATEMGPDLDLNKG